MSNPYQSPDPFSPTPRPQVPSPGSNSTQVKVKVLAILMLVQGGLELLMGLGLVGMGIFMLSMGSQIMAEQQRRGGAPPPPEWLFMIYPVIGGVLLVVAVVRIWAGVRNLSFKGRVLGIVANSLGIVSAMTCYCAPTSIGLLIYALIVYLDADVAQAFRQAEGALES